MGVHPTHKTRISDASSFDEICDVCGAHDEVPGGFEKFFCLNFLSPGHGSSIAAASAELANPSLVRRLDVFTEYHCEDYPETHRFWVRKGSPGMFPNDKNLGLSCPWCDGWCYAKRP